MNISSINTYGKKIPNNIVYLAALILSITSIFLAGSKNFEIKGLSVTAAIKPAVKGQTSINVPPFGKVQADTHKTPVNVNITLDRISIDDIKDIVDKNATKQSLLNDFEPEINKAVRGWFLKLVALGIAGGLMAPLLFRKNININKIIICAIIGGIASFSLLGLTMKTYDSKAFRQPRFSGMLSAAPWLLDAAQKKLESFSDFKSQVISMTENINSFQAKVKGWSATDYEKGKVKVLFISDIHNNPASLGLVKKVIKDFDIDLIIDAGDITDYGTELEAQMLKNIGALEVPYIFVPGNHDSENILTTLASQPNVKILNNESYSIKGLNLFGIGDPGATSQTIAPLPEAQSNMVAARNYELLKNMPKKPDILIGHNPSYTKLGAKLVKVTLNGHTHIEKIGETNNGKKIINAGTAGGAGIRGIGADKTVPISFKILYFNSNNKKLNAVDSISFSSISQEFTLQRTVFDKKTVSRPKKSVAAETLLEQKAGASKL